MNYRSVMLPQYRASWLGAALIALAGTAAFAATAPKTEWSRLSPGIEILAGAPLPAKLPGDAEERHEIALADGRVLQYELFPKRSAKEARLQLLAKRDAVLALYQARVEPYYGVADSGEFCDPARIPKSAYSNAAEETRQTLHAWATSNFVYGICEPKEIRFKSQLVLLHCPGSGEYAEVRFFYPKDAPWSEAPLARCRPKAP